AYSISLSSAVSSLQLTPTTTSATATIAVRINGGTYSSVVSGNASEVLTLNAGVNTIDVAVTAQDGTTVKTYTITVTKPIAQTITFAALNAATYGDAPIELAGTTDSGLPITYTIEDPSIATVENNIVTIRGGGTVEIVASQPGNDSFDPAAQVTQTLTINRLPLEVTINDAEKFYGDPDPEFSYTLSRVLPYNDVTNLQLGRSSLEIPGEMLIGWLSHNISNVNYDLTVNFGTLTIKNRPITITADAQSKTYGNLDVAITYQITSGSLVDGDELHGELARTPGENTASYPINIGSLGHAFYDITFNSAEVTITKAPLTITGNSSSKLYDGLPNTGGTDVYYDGFIAGEDEL
ncbi:MAG: cadherin-like beta sandwich domain-containing protein, partial [Sphingobacteriales bacterium]